MLSTEDQCRHFGLEMEEANKMDWEDDDDGQDVRMEEVLRGDMPLGMSHEGGELDDLVMEYRERM